MYIGQTFTLWSPVVVLNLTQLNEKILKLFDAEHAADITIYRVIERQIKQNREEDAHCASIKFYLNDMSQLLTIYFTQMVHVIRVSITRAYYDRRIRFYRRL